MNADYPGENYSHRGDSQRSRIPALSTELFPAGVTPRETVFWHLPPSVANVWTVCG